MNAATRRITERLTSYWEEVRAGRPCPAEADIDPNELEDVWDACFLVQIKEKANKKHTFFYNYLGSDLLEAYGDDLTGKEIYAELLDYGTDNIAQDFESVATSGQPLVKESEFRNRRGLLIRYRFCVLPLTNAADQIAYLFGGMKWKAF